MCRNALACILLASSVLSTAAAVADDPAWQPLFDGQSLDGWIQRGGEALYRVEAGTTGDAKDAAIVGTAVLNTSNTFLCTQRDFADFILEYDFKVDPRLNSGVQIRSVSVPGYRKGVVHGYQVEIDPTERAWTGGIYDESRRGVYLPDNKVAIEKNEAAHKAFKANDWNHARVECRGNSIKTWLNDVPVADVTDDWTHNGFIGLQVHSIAKDVLKDANDKLEVRWRNLRIKDLGDPWREPSKGAKATVLLGSNGDLSAWEHLGKPGSKVEWVWTGDALEVKPGSGNIVTKQPFGDCRLHVEFNVDDNGKTGQANGNSGVYLQGRYEVQILNSAGQDPVDDICGAIYKVKAEDENMSGPAGEWQTYDIWFHAPRWKETDGKKEKTANARITVYHNGTRVHNNVEVPGNTGAGQSEGFGDAPLMLQDHGNKVRFRNIWISRQTSAALKLDRQRDIPFVMFHRFPAFAARIVAGPLVAVWQNGRIVRADSEETIGESYVEGTLSAAQLTDILDFIADRPRLLELHGGYVVVDGGSDMLGIRTREHRVRYEETSGTNFGHDPDVATLRTYLMSINIPDAKPAEAPWKVPPKDWYSEH